MREATTLVGQRLGHYDVVARLGEGGMGEVYRATDTRLGRDVALKVLPGDMARDPDRLARFQREARAVAALNHPNIVTVHSVDEAEGVHFLTMELVEGASLDRVIPERGLSVERIVEMAGAIADALAAAHEKGIVHRDLKPANVMVTPDGRVKVLDFGLAKIAPGAASGAGSTSDIDATLTSAGRTAVGVVMGTPAYMSPEQVAGRPVDPRTDIFSLGVILYEMATGRRPFEGASSAELASAILRDTPPPVLETRADLPADLARIIRRCLEKDPRQRIQTARDVGNELGDLQRAPASTTARLEAARLASDTGSDAARQAEGFWVAVLPFKHRGADPALEALAEGLSEEVVTGLSRFSYLRVIARGSTARFASGGSDVRAAGRELGARYVMEGALRRAGSTLRVAVQLVDATTGAHLWAETYTRPFEADAIFDLQDDLAPRIVSTVADMNGVLPRSMSEELRSKSPDRLSPYEAVLRSFGYYARITPEEHAAVRAGLDRAVQQAPGYADAWAMLSMIYGEEFRFRFNAGLDPLGRALAAARKAVDVAPSNHLAYLALAQALFFRKEFSAFRSAADRAVALNHMDGSTIEYIAHLMAFAGDWAHGCAMAERARQLNPNHPEWYWAVDFFNAYRQGEYRQALALALKCNTGGGAAVFSSAILAAAYAQVGEGEAAGRAVHDLLALEPDFASMARDEFAKWYPPDLLEHFIEGLRKAGLAILDPAGVGGSASPSGPAAVERDGGMREPTPAQDAGVTLAVLPFADMSTAQDQQYLCEGMAEEIMNALVGVAGIRVASRTSAFRAQRAGRELQAIARALSVGHVLEGSVRTSGNRLRVTAQLTDVASGYQLWSERFDREAVDVFAVQDEIAAGVVEAVRARLGLGAGGRAADARPRASSFEAYRAYLQGRHLRHTKNDHAGAMRAFEEAVRLDPTHAPSWVGLAEGSVLAALYGEVPAGAGSAKARNALLRALHLQGESAEALAVEGLVAFVERRWRDAETAFRRALELEPDNVRALVPFGQILSIWAAHDEAQAVLARARAADPLAALPYAASGVGLLLARRREEAQGFFEQALAFEPENTLALWGSCMALVGLGRFDEGVGLATRAAALTGRAPFFLGLLGWALGSAGRSGEARSTLEELRAQPAASRSLVPEAWVLGALGDTDAAFARLERAEAEYQAFLHFTGLPAFDPLRADPRFDALLRQLGLAR